MELKRDLATWLKDCKRLVIMGIGNTLRSDDAIGIEIINQLEFTVPENVKILDCGMVPENFLEEVEAFKPTHVLMIDAAHFEAEPGHAAMISADRISGIALSTHAMPLSLLAGLITENIKAQVILLGVQPERTDFGEGLSPPLQKAASQIANVITEAINSVE